MLSRLNRPVIACAWLFFCSGVLSDCVMPNLDSAAVRPDIETRTICTKETPVNVVLSIHDASINNKTSIPGIMLNSTMASLWIDQVRYWLDSCGCRSEDVANGTDPTLEVDLELFEVGRSHSLGVYLGLAFAGIIPGLLYLVVPGKHWVVIASKARLRRNDEVFWESNIVSNQTGYRMAFADGSYNELFGDNDRIIKSGVVKGLFGEAVRDFIQQLIDHSAGAFQELKGY